MQRSYVLLFLLSISITASAMESKSEDETTRSGWEPLQEILNEPRHKSITTFLKELEINDDVENPSAIRKALTNMSPENYNKLVARFDENKYRKSTAWQQEDLANILIGRQLRKEEKCNNLIKQKDDQKDLLTKLVQKQRKQLAGCSIVAMILFAYGVGLSVYTLPFI